MLHRSVLTVALLAILGSDVLHAILNSFNGNTHLLAVGDSLKFLSMLKIGGVADLPGNYVTLLKTSTPYRVCPAIHHF